MKKIRVKTGSVFVNRKPAGTENRLLFAWAYSKDAVREMREQFAAECRAIREDTEEAGLPSNGYTYDLRIENLRQYYPSFV